MKYFRKIAALLLGAALAIALAGCANSVDDNKVFYSVTVSETVNGTVKASKTTGITAGETITLTVTPADGYKLESLSVKKGDTNVAVSDNSFKMPDGNVVVSAVFVALPPETYSITLNCGEHGTVTSNHTTATAGTEITITIKPSADYELETLSANDGAVTLSGTENTRTFTMPATNVTVNITFKTDFVKVPKGSFKRAKDAESTAYIITFTKDLYVCDHEVTQGEWEHYMTYYGDVYGKDKSGLANNYQTLRPLAEFGKGKDYPVYSICWYEAVIYCNLLSKAKGLEPVYYVQMNGESIYDPEKWAEGELGTLSHVTKTSEGKFYYNSTRNIETDTDKNIILFDNTKNGYRLPTEAEWEYAALGSFKDDSDWNGFNKTATPSNIHVFSGYDGTNDSDMEKYVWCEQNSGKTTHPVKGKLSNSYGLYDMSGNVLEFCWDWMNGDYDEKDETDPSGKEVWADGKIYRISRGGSFRYSGLHAFSVSNRKSAMANDYYVSPYSRLFYRGFRVVRTAE